MQTDESRLRVAIVREAGLAHAHGPRIAEVRERDAATRARVAVDLATVATVMASSDEREAGGAGRAAGHEFVGHPNRGDEHAVVI